MAREIRKARTGDVQDIKALVNRYAQRDLMLPRSLEETYDQLRDFFVCRSGDRLVGCAALHVSWLEMGEIRSLAVEEDAQGDGIGTRLVNACLEEAPRLGVQRVFTLTRTPEFFQRLGFAEYPKDELPHKVWSDCLKCPHFPDCDEVCLMIEV
jgi:amino-acid N-acetyltransferase